MKPENPDKEEKSVRNSTTISGPITGPVHTGSGDIHIDEQSVFSGDFRGAILNYKSTLDNVSQMIKTAPTVTQENKEELLKLMEQLIQELQKVPSANAEDAAAVAESAETLIGAATKEKANKTSVKITAEGLKAAAENIAKVMPTVLSISTQIIKTVLGFVGIPAI